MMPYSLTFTALDLLIIWLPMIILAGACTLIARAVTLSHGGPWQRASLHATLAEIIIITFDGFVSCEAPYSVCSPATEETFFGTSDALALADGPVEAPEAREWPGVWMPTVANGSVIAWRQFFAYPDAYLSAIEDDASQWPELDTTELDTTERIDI